MSDELVGKTLGRYRILSRIAQGGMATVYLGLHPTLDRRVAIKVLLPAYAQNREFVTRFQREALAAAGLRHPNIVHIYDAGQADGHYFIVMEYIEGGSLQDRLQQLAARGKRLDVTTSLNIARQIASALDYAHRHGIIHRDVKPSNILLTKEGQPILTDLGIAKAVAGTRLTKTMMGIGTPEYMSPEQGKGGKVDHRTDIYSLGVVLYEMLAGRAPFQADTPWAVIYQHIHETPPPLSAAIPPRVQDLVRKAMAKQPRDRYRTAAEMMQAIDQAMGVPAPVEVPVTRPPVRERVERPTVPAEPLTKPITALPRPGVRIPVVPMGIGALVLVLVVLGGILASWGLRSKPAITPTVGIAMAVPTSTPTQTPTRVVIITPTETPRPMAPTFTLVPTHTPTRVVAVAPVKTPTPIRPTSTVRPTSAPAPPTATTIPTSTPVPPTATPTPRPPTPTPKPSPTQVAYPAPTLRSPPDGAKFGSGNIVLQWQWPGQLGPDEYFDVRVWREGETPHGIAWEKGTTHAIDPRRWPGGKYYWSIVVIRGRGGRWEADLSPESAMWTFEWTGGPGPTGPQPTPTR